MIEISNIMTYGWEEAIRGMRNPMNSWRESDSGYKPVQDFDEHDIWTSAYGDDVFALGKKDQLLMLKLRNAGTDHRKFMRMITVYMDITAPLYWWKEFDTYKVGTVANSCSTMHKLTEKEFAIDDFSHEHMIDTDDGWLHGDTPYNSIAPLSLLNIIVEHLNIYREEYLSALNNKSENAKELWWQMIQLLPSSYNQKRTVMMNYEVLANIYKSRKNHKLDEWVEFCEVMQNMLPFSDLITGTGLVFGTTASEWEKGGKQHDQ